MNKRPLPVHLIANIPGYAMLGQCSFGGYFKIILSWWLNDCPEVFADSTEWHALSGMRTTDWLKYRNKIEPLLVKSFELLVKYRQDKINADKPRVANIRKALEVKRQKQVEREAVVENKGLVDSKHDITSVGVTNPLQKNYHEGWNLNKRNNTVKSTTYKPSLLDK